MMCGPVQHIKNIELLYLKGKGHYSPVQLVIVADFYMGEHMPNNGIIMQCDPLSRVSGIHAGRRAIVMGSGHSINSFDFSKLLKDDIIISCNQSITAVKHCNYFCMTDGAIPEAEFFQYGVEISDKILFCSGLSFLELPAVVAQYDKIKHKSYFFNRRYNNSSNLDFNLNDGLLIKGSDVVHVAAHLAHIMGCYPIVLVGVDLNYAKGKKYCDSLEYKKEVVWTPGKWFVSSLSSGDDDPNLSSSYNTWRDIKVQNPGVKFLNTNPQGKLSQLFDLYKWD